MVRGPRRGSPAATTRSRSAGAPNASSTFPDDVACGGASPAHLREQPDHVWALEAVQVHHVGARQHGQVRGLPALVAQPLEGRVDELAQLAAGRHLQADLVHLDAQAVALVGGALDVPVGLERREDAVHGALPQPEPARQLGHAEDRFAVAEGGDHGHGLAHGGVAARGDAVGVAGRAAHQVAPSKASQLRRASSAPAR